MPAPMFFEGAISEELVEELGGLAMVPALTDAVSVFTSTEVVADPVLVVVRARVGLGVRRIEVGKLLIPDREEAANEEKGTEVEGKIDCETEDTVLVMGPIGVLEGAGVCSLTEPPPGALIWPELDCQWGGKLGEAVGESVATQGQTLGVTHDEVSM